MQTGNLSHRRESNSQRQVKLLAVRFVLLADSLLKGVAGYVVGASFALVPHGGCLPVPMYVLSHAQTTQECE